MSVYVLCPVAGSLRFKTRGLIRGSFHGDRPCIGTVDTKNLACLGPIPKGLNGF